VGALLASSPCGLLVAAHDEVRCFHLESGGGGKGGGVVEAVPERMH